LQFHGQLKLLAAQQPLAHCRWLVVDRIHFPLLSTNLQQLGWIEAGKASRVQSKEESLLIFKPKVALP
jgi:hypothetical protein